MYYSLSKIPFYPHIYPKSPFHMLILYKIPSLIKKSPSSSSSLLIPYRIPHICNPIYFSFSYPYFNYQSFPPVNSLSMLFLALWFYLYSIYPSILHIIFFFKSSPALIYSTFPFPLLLLIINLIKIYISYHFFHSLFIQSSINSKNPPLILTPS